MSMIDAETKACQSCQVSFTIEPADFAFYETMQVPPPTWCPDCRAKRRLVWRNQRSLYSRTCAATGKPIITMFGPQSDIIVYDKDYWWSDEWDQLSSGREYDFTRTFFEQYRELLARAPLPNLSNSNAVNSDYGNYNADINDCYLLFASYRCDNVSYSNGGVESRDSMDLYLCNQAENCYDCSFGDHIYGLAFGYDVDATTESAFIRASNNLNHCTACINLGHKSNYLWNQPLSEDAYKQKVADLNLGSYEALQAFSKQYDEFIKPFPRRFATLINTENCTGDMIQNAKNAQHCFDIVGDVENSKYVTHAVNLKDAYDGHGMGAHSELLYEGVDSAVNGYRYTFTGYTHNCKNVAYTYGCHNSQYLFGCVGLRSKQYCIFNKQYTKAEYEALVPKIIQQMNQLPYVDQLGREYRFGEFFPPYLSPFAYNESIGREYQPLSKDEALAQGFRWQDPQPSEHPVTMQAADLPDHIKDVTDSILTEVVGCAHKQTCDEQCTQAFKIQPQELAFYLQRGLALPRLCPNCRHYGRVKQRNPLQLHRRSCDCQGRGSARADRAYTNLNEHSTHTQDELCTNQFDSPNSTDRPEIVYCEPCYLREVV